MIVEPKVPADGDVQTGRHRRDPLAPRSFPAMMVSAVTLPVATVTYYRVTYDMVTNDMATNDMATNDMVTNDVVEQPAMNVARRYRYRWR
ncbi:MAG: hypothetical protein QOC63_3967 [Mycobacterium sp.]|jgi:hypothetical protein|nr:hypothetical protein [Mycobacterium sp.]